MASSENKESTGTSAASAAAAYADAVANWPGAWSGGTGLGTYSGWQSFVPGDYEIDLLRSRSDLIAENLPSTPAAAVQNTYLYFDSIINGVAADYDAQGDALATGAFEKFRDWTGHGLTTKASGVDELTTNVYNDVAGAPPNYDAGGSGSPIGWIIAVLLSGKTSQLILDWAVTDGFTYRE